MNEKNNPPRVSIVILNWNGWEDTIECLESVYQINYERFDVIVVDNASTDDSIEKIKVYCSGGIKVQSEYFNYMSGNKPIQIFEYSKQDFFIENSVALSTTYKGLKSNKKLILITNEKNDGYAAGNNVGIRFALKLLKPGYILILNNDVVVEKSFLFELINSMEKEEKIGIASPEIRIYNEPDKIQEFFPPINLDFPSEAEWISGSVMLIRADLIKKVGLLDPIYFLFYEELDYCTRIRRLGYKITYIPTAGKVYHKESESVKKNLKVIPYYRTRNYFIFKKKFSTTRDFINALLNYFITTFPTEVKRYIFLHMLPQYLKGLLVGLFYSLRIRRE